jgi:hypothetical protein
MPAINFIKGNEGIEKTDQSAGWFFSKQGVFFHQVLIPEKNLSVCRASYCIKINFIYITLYADVSQEFEFKIWHSWLGHQY